MNIQKFIDYALSNGLSSVQVFVSKSAKTSVKIYHSEVEKMGVADSQSLLAMGICNGKIGTASTEKLDNTTFDFLLQAIKDSASVNENSDFLDFYEGDKKYHKRNVYSKALDEWKTEDVIKTLREVENKIYSYDKRISDVTGLSFSSIKEETEIYNSYGLKLKQKSNYYFITTGVVAKDKDEVKTGYEAFADNDPGKFNVDEFVRKAATETLEKLGGGPCESKKYPTILKASVFADILDYFIGQLSAEEVEKHSSLAEGKIGQKIASSKLTIYEKPLAKNIFFSFFDDEGVAKENKAIIKNGVLLTYLHNRKTAAKMGVKTTGNGAMTGIKMGISYSNIFVKPGKKTFEELLSTVKEGVYITDIAGLGTGINPRSGDFSCQAEGFLIKDGKVERPLSLITLSGNLMKMLKDIREFDDREELETSSFSLSDVLIKSMNIGGK